MEAAITVDPPSTIPQSSLSVLSSSHQNSTMDEAVEELFTLDPPSSIPQSSLSVSSSSPHHHSTMDEAVEELFTLDPPSIIPHSSFSVPSSSPHHHSTMDEAVDAAITLDPPSTIPQSSLSVPSSSSSSSTFTTTTTSSTAPSSFEALHPFIHLSHIDESENVPGKTELHLTVCISATSMGQCSLPGTIICSKKVVEIAKNRPNAIFRVLENPTSFDEVLKMLESLLKSSRWISRVVVYWSGHTLKTTKHAGSLLLANNRSIEVSEMIQQLKNRVFSTITLEQFALVLDVCFSKHLGSLIASEDMTLEGNKTVSNFRVIGSSGQFEVALDNSEYGSPFMKYVYEPVMRKHEGNGLIEALYSLSIESNKWKWKSSNGNDASGTSPSGGVGYEQSGFGIVCYEGKWRFYEMNVELSPFLKELDSSVFITNKTRDFVGRESLFKDVEAWRSWRISEQGA